MNYVLKPSEHVQHERVEYANKYFREDQDESELVQLAAYTYVCSYVYVKIWECD